MGRNQLFLNFLRGQPKKCTLNIDSQSEKFLKEREKEMGRVAKGSLFSYFKTLNSLKG